MLKVVTPPAADAGVLLRNRLTGFAGFLRANGFAGGEPVHVLDVAERVGALDPQLVRWSLKALLCGRSDEWQRFDALFDTYFLPPNRKAFTQRRVADARAPETAGTADSVSASLPIASGDDEVSGDDAPAQRYAASREESLAATDFRDLDVADDARRIEVLMRRFARRMKLLRLRREARAPRGRRLDFQGTIRRSVASGGTPFRLAWKERRRVRPRLVLLLDVSRSMSRYSFFFLRLARALSHELADVHSFIFHTRLTGVSEALRDPDSWRSQERLHLLAAGWGGGTRIGESVQSFNRDHAPRLVHSRTAVIIVSDGYDTGEPALLGAALATLRRRARRIVWLNPLLRQPDFSPESRGMQAALPHLDLFAPGADLASIEHLLPRLLETLR